MITNREKEMGVDIKTIPRTPEMTIIIQEKEMIVAHMNTEDMKRATMEIFPQYPQNLTVTVHQVEAANIQVILF